MYRQKQPVAKGKVGQILLRLKMALKHFWLRRRLQARDRMRRRIKRYYAEGANLRRESLAGLYRRKLITLLVLVLSILGCGLLVFPTIAREPSGIPGGTLDMFNANDIPYWDPCAGGSSGGGGGGTSTPYGGDIQICGETAHDKIYTGLVSMFESMGGSLKEHARELAAGAASNMFHEGNDMNPVQHEESFQGSGIDIYHDAGPSYGIGLVQWSFGRRVEVLDYILSKDSSLKKYFDEWQTYSPGFSVNGQKLLEMVGDDIYDKLVALELEFTRFELENKSQYSGILSQTTVEGAAGWWSDIYEACGDCHPGGGTYAQRVADAPGIYDQYKDFQCSGGLSSSSSSSSSSSNSNSSSNDGSNVLVIGDSITVMSTDEIKSKMPNAEIIAKGAMPFSWGRDRLKEQTDLRDVIVFAMGTNNQPVIPTSEAEEVIAEAGSNRKVIFLTNYANGASGLNYTKNNELFRRLASQHDNVIVVDWEAEASKDSGKYMNPNDVHPNAEGQKLFAQLIYDAVKEVEGGGSGDDDCIMGNSSAQIDSEGWITGGIEGLVKESALNVPLSESPDSHPKFTTSDGKAQTIILHHTAGGPCNGLACYGGNLYPPHFTINLKEKKGWQHFPMNRPSLATKYADDYGVQIEIISYGNSTINCIVGGTDPQWDTANFTDEEWDYLAQYMLAISEYTGVPLESSLDWSRANVAPNWQSFNGVMGHMHNQSDKCDPGNIWKQVKAAIDRAGGGEYCTVSETDICGNVTSTGTKPKSGSVSALQEYVLKYAWKVSDPEAGSATSKPEYSEAYSKAPYKGGGITDCGAFVQILMHDSGWDSSFYGVGATGEMLKWLGNPANGWEKITPTDVSQLQPGDVAVWDDGMGNGHTWVFVGDIPGFGSQFADASWGTRTPAATSTGLHYNGETWFRKKGQ